MTEAETARANSISLEVKKDGLTQRQSGDWQLRFTVAAVDMHDQITTAPMGTRFACVLVEITDDESPRDYKSEERNKWADLGYARQAGIRCKDPIFWAYLREYQHYSVYSEEAAAKAVRDFCDVASRADLEKPGMNEQRELWRGLDRSFEAWKARENG